MFFCKYDDDGDDDSIFDLFSLLFETRLNHDDDDDDDDNDDDDDDDDDDGLVGLILESGVIGLI